MAAQKTKNKIPKKDITLMTLIACEATGPARRILKKHGVSDAKNYDDLEVKLAQLYFHPETDKIALEKELAEIHPHRNWLMKYAEPQVKEVMVEVPAPAAEPVVIKEEIKSNASGSQEPTPILKSQMRTIDYVAIISVAGLVGITVYVVSKSFKNS